MCLLNSKVATREEEEDTWIGWLTEYITHLHVSLLYVYNKYKASFL